MGLKHSLSEGYRCTIPFDSHSHVHLTITLMLGHNNPADLSPARYRESLLPGTAVLGRARLLRKVSPESRHECCRFACDELDMKH